MPLDITLFRKEGGNPELIRESQRRRFASVELVDEIIAKDDHWRSVTGNGDFLRKERNTVQKEIATLKKSIAQQSKTASAEALAALNAQCDVHVANKTRLDGEIEAAELLQKQLKAEVDQMINKVGNIVHDSVPVSKDEDKDNRVERTWGTPRNPAGLLNHHDLLWRIGGYEPERGSVVAGHRGYFLRDVGVMLNQAFINYGIAFLRQRGYCCLQPPYMMRKDIMAGVAQLEQFDEELYKVSGDGDDKYLIATSEQPICAYHKDEWMDEKQLPLFYAGISTCFRKEAGSHGKDTWGIFRVHQFEKVEQFALVDGDLEKSNAIQEEMIRAAEEFYQSLGFPYQVINIVSGALNNAAIRKYDLECWFPGYNNYRELVSCSNCTDYQSRAMEIRAGQKKMGDREKKYVHMLNATLCATGRAICCLLENYQEADGVRIPEVLVPFMGGMTFLPFVRESKLDATPANASGKAVSPTVATKKAEPAAPKKTETTATEVPPPVAPATASTEAAAAPAPAPVPDTATAKQSSKKTKKTNAPIPESKPAPSYVSPAPWISSQVNGGVTDTANASQVPSIPQIVGESTMGEDVEETLMEQRLQYYSYVGGDVPSHWDARLFASLHAREELTAYKSIQRWLRHIATFPETDRAQWK
jgi:seryl-tRNA synthetase